MCRAVPSFGYFIDMLLEEKWVPGDVSDVSELVLSWGSGYGI